MIENGLVELSRMIYQYCGLNYTDRLMTLREKISKRVKELNLTYWEYGKYLKMSPLEWDHLIEILTINETYFYREEHQLNECCSNVLPKLKEEIHTRPIRIWSAACSTGEEPYTLAMLIQETKKFPPGSVQIIGTDINKKVLEKAKNAWYHNSSFAFRRIPKVLMKKYFVEQDGGYKIIKNIRDMVEFHHLNLLEADRFAPKGEVDIIFCRNVLIYFDQETTKKVIRNLYQKLTPGGYLFLGHAESITDLDLGFQKIDSDKTFYYRKELKQHEEVRYISR
ncbi:chemotaxis protein CheR [Bacillus sp. X1(2014)]|nr:chemotaxis protein CheR [Bacillus sp. X1(2014)]